MNSTSVLYQAAAPSVVSIVTVIQCAGLPRRWSLTPAGLRYTPAGLRYTPAGLRYTPAGLRYTPAGLRYTPAGLR